MSDLQLDLKSWPSALAEFGGVFYADHVRFDPRHPFKVAVKGRGQLSQIGAESQSVPFL